MLAGNARAGPKSGGERGCKVMGNTVYMVQGREDTAVGPLQWIEAWAESEADAKAYVERIAGARPAAKFTIRKIETGEG